MCQQPVEPIWLADKQKTEMSVSVAQATVYQFESLATRQERLRSMASVAVDLACANGAVKTSELESCLKSFIQALLPSGSDDASMTAKAMQEQANPLLQKNQRQVRLQPFAGPTTKAAAQQSRQRKAAKKNQKKAHNELKTADFLK
jgi:hypothetical protein